VVCQASALPLSYGPINRIREQAKCPKLVPKSTPNLSFPRKSWGPKPLASLARRWLGVSTDLGWGGQGVFTLGGRNKDVREDATKRIVSYFNILIRDVKELRGEAESCISH